VFRSDSSSFQGESGSIAKRFTDFYQVIPISIVSVFRTGGPQPTSEFELRAPNPGW